MTGISVLQRSCSQHDVDRWFTRSRDAVNMIKLFRPSSLYAIPSISALKLRMMLLIIL